MNKQKIEYLIDRLIEADQIEVEGECESVHLQWASSPDCEIVGEPENQLVNLVWENDPIENIFWNHVLTEQGLSDATISNNDIFLVDNEGKKVHLRLWERTPMDLNCSRYE